MESQGRYASIRSRCSAVTVVLSRGIRSRVGWSRSRASLIKGVGCTHLHWRQLARAYQVPSWIDCFAAAKGMNSGVQTIS